MMTDDRTLPASSVSHPRERAVAPVAARAGQAGFLAALIMLAAQLFWRLEWSRDGVVQVFPEFIVAAIARLTPLSVFGAATETYGSLAKKSLFVAVLIGIVAVGFQAGNVAERISRRFDRGAGGRLAAGGIVAGALFLFTLVVVMPIAYLGLFAVSSSYTGDILLHLIVTFAIFAVAWALLSAPRTSEAPVGDDTVTRREVVSAGWAAATLAAVAAVGGMTWRIFNPVVRRAAETAAGEGVADDIVATQRARQGFPLPTETPPAETPTPVVESAASRDVASLHADVAAQEDPFALFQQLDAEGKITPLVTEVEDFYHVSKNIVDPTVSSDGWTLKVTGLVEKELELTYDEIVARSTTQKITTLCCISNELNGDLIDTAEWTGFPFKDLLEEAGVKEGAVDIKLHCSDDYEDSFPVAYGFDPDTLVVTGMNGATLPDDHGFPARVIVPGIYGMKNVKWLERIEVVDEDFQGYWQTRGWSDPAIPQIWARVDAPGGGDEIAPGPFVAAGVASAGDRDIARVEVSLDDGGTWADAQLEPSLNPPFTWVRWAFPFEATEGKHQMRIRITDGTGAVATEERRSPLPDGATGWPTRTVNVDD